MIKIGKDISKFSYYSYQPKTAKELKAIINARIAEEGSDCNLNDIDTSLITDMGWLFDGSGFNGDISKWNTSRVKYMPYMFLNSDFNGDISKWNISKVESMEGMFERSKFN